MKKLALLCLLGCGHEPLPIYDAGVPAREAFFGTWDGPVVLTVTLGGSTQSNQQTTSWQLRASALSDDRVAWDTVACHYQAKATSDSSLVLDPVTCSPQVNDAGCSATFSVIAGSGLRAGTSLSITDNGSVVYQCSGGGPQSGTFTMRFDGTKH